MWPGPGSAVSLCAPLATRPPLYLAPVLHLARGTAGAMLLHPVPFHSDIPLLFTMALQVMYRYCKSILCPFGPHPTVDPSVTDTRTSGG